MGLRIRFRVAPRAALERAASSTLAGTASTVGWRFAVTDVRGEAALVARGAADLVLFRDSVPGVSLEAVPDLTLRDLATRSTRALEMVLRALEGAPWPGVRLVQEGYRRWWVGGIAHVAAGQHMREALRGDLEHLGRRIRCVRTVARAARRRDRLPGAVRQLVGDGGILSQPISCSSSTGSS